MTYEDLGGNRIGHPLVKQLRQRPQHDPHTARLVFDPGGLVFVLAPHEDFCKCKLRTHNNFVTSHNAATITHVLDDHSTVFSTEIPII